MQQRHFDRNQYFKELSITSEKYFMPYISNYHEIDEGISILEIGCGEGGNLLPFAKLGCKVVGIDISEKRINEAKELFRKAHIPGTFICNDIFNQTGLNHRFDIIICHDVIEHIEDKYTLLIQAHSFIKNDGVLFIAFPAWQMPFGGHQQICRNSFIARFPFIHLLPFRIYKQILAYARESKEMINELLSIRKTRITIEAFEKLASLTHWNIADRSLYLINPHYKIKFGLTPLKLPACISNFRYIRNFISTSCFYLLRPTKN